MAFLKDLFEPKWKHSNPAVRKAAIEKITDYNLLVEIIENERDNEIKDYANERLSKTGKVSIVAYEINAGRNKFDTETAKKICASFLKSYFPFAKLDYSVIIGWPDRTISKDEASITYISLVNSYRLNNCGEPFKRENAYWNNKMFYVMFFDSK
jgi:hypothetical protein